MEQKVPYRIPVRLYLATIIVIPFVLFWILTIIMHWNVWFAATIATIFFLIGWLSTYCFCGIGIGSTLVAIEHPGNLYTIHIREISFIRTVATHRKSLSVLHVLLNDFRLIEDILPSGSKVSIETWIMGNHIAKQAKALGYRIEPMTNDFAKRGMLIPLLWIVKLLTSSKKVGPFNKRNQSYRLTKTL